jgi:hypothetical protein
VSVAVSIAGKTTDALTTSSEMFATTMRAFEWNVTGTLNQANYSTEYGGTGTSFLLAFDLQSDEGSGFLSGNSTQAPIELKVVHSSPPPINDPWIYDAFLMVDRIVTLTPDGVDIIS